MRWSDITANASTYINTFPLLMLAMNANDAEKCKDLNKKARAQDESP